MTARVKSLVLVLATLGLNVFLDRVTKMMAIDSLKGHDPLSFWGDLIVLQYTENSGAFLSLGSTWPTEVKAIVFLALPLVACLLALLYCVLKEKNTVRMVLIASIAAGGAANLFDRLFNSFHVVDFLNFGVGPLRTGILNVADLSITLGAVALVLYEATRSRTELPGRSGRY